MLSVRRRQLTAASLLMVSGIRPSSAQGVFPNRPLRLIIPFATGGPTDTMARALASRLTEELGQQVVTENRPGAGGNIGTELVAKAGPDGYTILIATNGPLAANKSLFAKLPFDPLIDLAPISMFVYQPNVLAVHPDVPARNVTELIAWLKANPGKSYGSGGLGTSTHFAGELFRSLTGVQIEHVAYKGDGQSVPDVVAGIVPLVFCSVIAAMKWIESGRLRALGVTSLARVPVVPDIPPIAESGLAGFDLTSWYAVLVPARTPDEVARTLNAAMLRAMANPDLRTRLEGMGSILAPSTPQELRQHMERETARWGQIVKQTGIKL